ncbi:hypothetical protein [Thermoactinospora rubra]|uniref:hypothetical protein n=1 Tax=Thermoactinospora rubra TaxID=1088767 RepID=UPI000A0F4142|nr:hypothetical protein [Thermoactinospora rubra]
MPITCLASVAIESPSLWSIVEPFVPWIGFGFAALLVLCGIVMVISHVLHERRLRRRARTAK